MGVFNLTQKSILCAVLCSLVFELNCQINFVSQSTQLGLADTTRSYGLFWGDINNDGFPDLYLPNHYNFYNEFNPDYKLVPQLFINQNGISFEELHPERLSSNDFHGAAFFKFESDSIMDLLLVTGGGTGELLFENPVNDFTSPSDSCGPCIPTGRGRNITLLDVDNDGRTDILAHQVTPHANQTDFVESVVYLQNQNGEFESTYSHALPQSKYGFIGDLNNDQTHELTVLGNNSFRVYKYDSLGIDLIYEEAKHYTDALLEDFNNDGQFEMILSSAIRSERIEQINDFRIEAYFKNYPETKEFEFTASQDFRVDIASGYTNNFNSTAGFNNNQLDPVLPVIVDLDDPTFNGTNEQPTLEHSFHIGYNPNSGLWKISTNGLNNDEFRISVRSEGFLELINFEGINSYVPPVPALVIKQFESINDSLIVSSEYILDYKHISAMATADFDNDGDIDLITSNFNDLYKEPYTVYINDGSGNFQIDSSLIDVFSWNTLGHTDAISIVDYDLDGKIDIAGVNGWGGEWGANEIYRNISGQNNWVVIDLEGTLSNRMGIGATVHVYSGGIHQMRISDGGFHKRAQDDMRLHFGTGQETIVDSVMIDWPSGIKTKRYSLGVNMSHYIKETTEDDIDGDGVLNQNDICPEVYNPGQTLITYYYDGDGDGYGNPLITDQSCSPEPSFVSNSEDCDDNDSNINPAEIEECDNIDNDCSGVADDGLIQVQYFQDSDGDGYGNPLSYLNDCSPPTGYVLNNLDCNDLDSLIHPMGLEFCDSIDNNCNGILDDPGCDNCVFNNFVLAPEGLMNIQINGKSLLKWSHYSDHQEGCLVGLQRVNSQLANVGEPIEFLISDPFKLSPDIYNQNRTGVLSQDHEFLKFNPNTYPNGNYESWIPGAKYKWRVKCGCIIDNDIPYPFKVHPENLHMSPWSDWKYITNTGLAVKYTGVDVNSKWVSVQPNPTTGIVNIGIHSKHNDDIEIRLFDVLGEEIVYNIYSTTEGLNELRLDLTEYSNGVYLLIISNEVYSESFRIIKS